MGGKSEESEPEYKWLWQAPQIETLASICEGQAQFPQRIKSTISQPNPQTGKKTRGPGQSHSPFGIIILKENAVYPCKNSE